MKRYIPQKLLLLLERWLTESYLCVKWKHAWSVTFRPEFGVRQGSVLSPLLFAVYVDDLAKSCIWSNSIYILLYADDILLIAATVCELQKLLYICEHELSELDMSINIQKTCCLRIGPRHNAPCAAISMSSGTAIPWVDKIRYLGVFIARSHVFRCDLDHAKKSFYRAANAIFVKVGRAASEEVVIQLVSKCIPVLMYGLYRSLPINQVPTAVI